MSSYSKMTKLVQVKMSPKNQKHTNLNRVDPGLAKDALHFLLKSLPTNVLSISCKIYLDVITGFIFLIMVKLNLNFL